MKMSLNYENIVLYSVQGFGSGVFSCRNFLAFSSVLFVERAALIQVLLMAKLWDVNQQRDS